MFENIKFSHAFQPIVDINRAAIVSYEVLLRSVKNEGPDIIFRQIQTDKLDAFDQISREQALLLASHLKLNCSLNLNFTPGSILFNKGHYLAETLNKFRSLGFDSKHLTVEITERNFFKNISLLSEVLNSFRKDNIVIAIDDFGAGYAGLNLLADIQPDLIKIDMSLLRDIHKNGPRQAIVRAACSVCLDLGIDVLAEGVETEDEFKWLQHIGIFLYQGNLFAKPAFERLPTFDELNYPC